MSSHVLIDGRDSTWPDFVDALMALTQRVQLDGAAGQVLAPRGCRVAAERLIRDLDLADYLTVADAPHGDARSAASSRRRGAGIATTLLGALGLQPVRHRQPTCD